MATGKEMCTTIVNAIRVSGTPEDKIPTSEEVWEASPTGELHHLPPLYKWAKGFLRRHNRSDLILGATKRGAKR